MLYIHILVTIAIIQQILDMWTTIKALETGRAREANGPLRKLMDKVGVTPALLIVKIPFCVTLLFMPSADWQWFAVLGLLIAGYTWLLYNNFTVLRRIGVL